MADMLAAEAGDGGTAITEYDRTRADIVLMDITMPQMEGIEAAERIVRQHPEARVIMVSSVGYQENIVAALQKGARHFVQKPVKPELLYEVIKLRARRCRRHRLRPRSRSVVPMRMELIQPFINAADAVLSETLACPVDGRRYFHDRRRLSAPRHRHLVEITGDIEGRVIFDVEDSTAMKVASASPVTDLAADPQLIREAVAELANLVIGNAVTTLNDQGFRFKVIPRRSPQPAGLLRLRGHRSAGHGFPVSRRQRLHEHRHALQPPPPPRRLRLEKTTIAANSKASPMGLTLLPAESKPFKPFGLSGMT